MKKIILLTSLIICSTPSIAADTAGDFFVRPYVGLSFLSDMTANSNDIGSTDGKLDVDLDSGFLAGLGFGYRYNGSFAVELAWEYRSNESKTTLPDGEKFNEGNLASNLFFLNGFYYLEKVNHFQPYLGAGLSWAQEIDIDLEKNGVEESYSGDGDIGYQVFIGSDYMLSEQFNLNAELRYGSISNIDLKGENIDGSISDIDYEPITLQLGMTYRF